MLRLKSVYYGWTIVGLAVTISLVAIGTSFSFGVFIKPLEMEFGWSRASISFAYGLYMLLHLVVAPFTGWVTDRYGPKIVLCTGGFLTGLGLLLSSQINSIWQLYLFYGLAGVGMGGISVPLIATISKWFVQRRGFALGVYTAGSGGGVVVIAPILGAIITSLGWRAAFLFIGIIALIVMISAGALIRKQPRASDSLTSDDKLRHSEEQKPMELTGLTVKQAVKTTTFWMIFVVYTIWSISQMMVATHLVVYAEDQGLSTVAAASILSIVGGVTVVARIGMGAASDKWNTRYVLMLCYIIMGSIMLWLVSSSSYWMFCCFAVFWGIGFGGTTPVVVNWVGELFGLRHMGAIIGPLAAEFGAGAAIGPPLAGYIYDTTGSYTIPFVSGAIMIIICSVIVYFIRAPKWQNHS